MEQSWNGFIRKAVGVLEKYLEISKIYMKTQLAWRGDVLFNMFFTIARIIFAYLLWGIVFQNHEMVGQFTFHGMLSYYIIHSFLSQLEMSDGISAEIHDRIRNGTFSKYIVIAVGVDALILLRQLYGYLYFGFTLYLQRMWQVFFALSLWHCLVWFSWCSLIIFWVCLL